MPRTSAFHGHDANVVNTPIRECRNCGPIPISEWKLTSSGLKCRYCIRRVQRNNYRIHVHQRREKAQKERLRNAHKRRFISVSNLYAEIDILKKNPCVDCGGMFEPECMDFDHIGPKTHSISRLVQQRYSFEFITNELKNTELVCVLCHRTRSYTRSLGSAAPRILNPNPKQARARANREWKKSYVNTLKQNPCSACGSKLNSCQMDFDHIDPITKFREITDLVRGGYSVATLKLELSKCRLLCALCHRRNSSVKVTR